MTKFVKSHHRLTAEDSFPAPHWFRQQMSWVQNPRNPENSAYNYPLALRIRGPLDPGILQQSIQEIVRRHQPLRSVFRVEEGRLMQIVLPPESVALSTVDLNDVGEAEREAAVLRHVAVEANRHFDLSRDLLLRAKLWRIGHEDHLLLLTTHYMVCDNWSIAILLRELSLLYEAFSAGQRSPLPEIAFQYGDFVRWQQRWLENRASENMAFWQHELAGTGGFHHLPIDYSPPKHQSYRGQHEWLTLDKSLIDSLKALACKEKVTPFMVLLAALQCLLCRRSGQPDIGIASCVANRQLLQAQKLIGHFSNHVVFRANLANNPAFRELLQRTRNIALAAYSYQSLPFGSVVKQWEASSANSRRGLFQILLVLTDGPEENRCFPGLDVSRVPVNVGSTPYDLIIWLSSRSAVDIHLQYNSDIFEVTTVRGILTNYRAVLELISKDPEVRVGDLNIARAQAKITSAPDNESPSCGPKECVESQLVSLWESAFDKRPIAVDDDFFELGGHSLLAAQLFVQIEEIFGTKIPLIRLIDCPTIQKLAGIIRLPATSNTSRSLVAIQPGDTRPPLFCIHGESGNLLMYRQLAYYLGPDQPVYGLQPQGLDGKQSLLTRIEDMAARYVKEIQAIQPDGPYFLVGYCMGGTIAFEMAQQLTRQGQRVDLLALLDTYNWRMTNRALLHELYFNTQRWWFSCLHFASTSSKGKLKSLKPKVQELWNTSELSKCNRRAAYAYVPEVYCGRILHVRPTRQYARYTKPEIGWEKLVTGGVEVFYVPSYPAQLVEEPFVRDLAAKVKSCIAQGLAIGNSPATPTSQCELASMSLSTPLTAASQTTCRLPMVVDVKALR